MAPCDAALWLVANFSFLFLIAVCESLLWSDQIALTMTTTITVPDKYGYVILSCTVLPWMASIYMAGAVMKARKEFNVLYPNLYATPGYHKQADEFNRVQRGHQNSFELMTTFTITSLLGGLKYPIACSLYGVFFSLGNVLYLKGYADTSFDVQTARYKKGGIIRIIGLLASIGSTVSLAGSLNGWW